MKPLIDLPVNAMYIAILIVVGFAIIGFVIDYVTKQREKEKQ